MSVADGLRSRVDRDRQGPGHESARQGLVARASGHGNLRGVLRWIEWHPARGHGDAGQDAAVGFVPMDYIRERGPGYSDAVLEALDLGPLHFAPPVRA